MTRSASYRRIDKLYSEFLDTAANGHAAHGLSLLRIILRYHRSERNSFDFLDNIPDQNEISLYRLSMISEDLGFRSRCIHLSPEQLFGEAHFPCIIQSGHNNFKILFLRRRLHSKCIDCLTPGQKVTSYSKREFITSYAALDNGLIPTLLLEPADNFFRSDRNTQKRSARHSIAKYFLERKTSFGIILFSFLITSMAQISAPFLMQAIVDAGINPKDIDYVAIILGAQLFLVLSKVSAEYISNSLILHASTVVNVNVLSDFLIKLARLPIFYFDRHHVGQILQRIDDSREIQRFLASTLSIFYALINFVVFSILLLIYNVQLFLFLLASFSLYFFWTIAFLKARKKINDRIFEASSKENNVMLQYLQGMPEIRLHNSARSRRWEWEGIQGLKYRLLNRRLRLDQFQHAGATLISQGKDVFLTYLVARLVIHDDLTLGGMVAILYIISQLSGPIDQFIGFIPTAQDARISLGRLNEVHRIKEDGAMDGSPLLRMPPCKTITITGLSFAYPNAETHRILKNINLNIPENKITAIVGSSGSGKTTLLKILLKFYPHYQGGISIANTDFKKIEPSFWRDQCGAVMQDGYIFSDTIAKNIAVGHEEPDYSRLRDASRMVNILSFIDALPLGFDTLLGAGGMEVSQGQKQRILIARVIYKDPQFLFFDESTNSLDTKNERQIWENLESFFRKKTVVIVAHRLSTVRNADNIVVIHDGEIVEEGNHSFLSQHKGYYFELVKNQLELGA